MMRGRRGIALFDGTGRNGGRDGNELDGLHRHSSTTASFGWSACRKRWNGQMYVPMGPFKPVGRARPVRAHGKGISWLRHDGVTAPFVLDGPMDSPHFLAYVEQVLAPTLKKDQSFWQCFHHEVEGVEEAIEARGARASFLPAYSPDRIHSTSAFDQLIFGLRNSCEREEFVSAFVMRLAPVSTLVGTCSPLEA